MCSLLILVEVLARSTMKTIGVTLVLLVSLVFVTIQDDHQINDNLYLTYLEECQEEGNYTDEELQDVLELKTNTSYRVGCLTACADEAFGLIENGTYHNDKKSRDIFVAIDYKAKDGLDHTDEVMNECFGKGEVYILIIVFKSSGMVLRIGNPWHELMRFHYQGLYSHIDSSDRYTGVKIDRTVCGHRRLSPLFFSVGYFKTIRGRIKHLCACLNLEP